MELKSPQKERLKSNEIVGYFILLSRLLNDWCTIYRCVIVYICMHVEQIVSFEYVGIHLKQ